MQAVHGQSKSHLLIGAVAGLHSGRAMQARASVLRARRPDAHVVLTDTLVCLSVLAAVTGSHVLDGSGAHNKCTDERSLLWPLLVGTCGATTHASCA